MHRRLSIVIATTALLGGAHHARAQSDSVDGYCDYVKGVADSERALLHAPELFSSFGYVDQLSVVASPGGTGDDLRFTFGVGYSLGGLYQSRLLKKRAQADCRRQRALASINGGTTQRALAARAGVLEEALGEAEEMLAKSERLLRRRQTTRQEVVSTRLRVDALRDLLATTRRQLETLPKVADDRSLARAMAAYHRADRQVESRQASLRQARAWDVSLRVGYDKFLDNDDSSPYFAVVSARFNLGWFLQRGADRRAAAGRKRIVRDKNGTSGVDAMAARLRAVLRVDRKRAEETGALVAELEDQLSELRKLGGESSRKLARTVWFEWVEVKAEHAYLTTHVASLERILGKEAD
jgi:hypothetical protein